MLGLRHIFILLLPQVVKNTVGFALQQDAPNVNGGATHSHEAKQQRPLEW